MARTTAVIGYGSTLSRGASGPPGTEPSADSYTEIAELTNIGLPEVSFDVLPATHTGTPSGWKEFVAGMKNPGELVIEGHFLPAQATHGYDTGLLLDFHNKTLRNFKVDLADAGDSEVYFAAFVSKVKVNLPLEGKITFQATLSISGVVDLSDLDS